MSAQDVRKNYFVLKFKAHSLSRIRPKRLWIRNTAFWMLFSFIGFGDIGKLPQLNRII
jgi:hypothetical protein